MYYIYLNINLMINIGYNNSNNHTGDKSSYECPARTEICINSLRKKYPQSMFIDSIAINKNSGLDLVKLVHSEKYIESILTYKPQNIICRNCLKRNANTDNTFDELITNNNSCNHCSNKFNSNNIYCYLSIDTYFTPSTFNIVLDGVKVLKKLLDNIKDQKIIYGFGLIRPPGHHCCNDANGFCIVNNAMISAKYAQTLGYSKILILDIDFHHGDGTQKLITENNLKDIYLVSIYGNGELIYPGYGKLYESSENILNIPLDITIDPLSRLYITDEYYQNILNSQVFPFIANVKPDLIIISNGLDAHKDDPLEGFNITDDTYLYITSKLKELSIPLLFILEGGYSINALNRVIDKMISKLITL